jgi:hypothetical protein
MKSKVPELDPSETSCFTVPHSEEIFSNYFISVFCFVFVRQDLHYIATVLP